MSLLDLVQQQLGPSQIQQISQQLGADPHQTEEGIHAALPMLLGGMAGTARQPGGLGGITQAFGQVGGMGGGGGLGGLLGGLLGGGAAGGLGGMLGGAGGGGGLGGMLGGLLGNNEPAVQSGVQQASGLNGDQTKKLLMILAPIVIAALMQRRQQQRAPQMPQGGGLGGMLGGAMGGAAPGMGGAGAVDSDGDGIPDYLEQEAREAQTHAQRRNPQIGGLVGKILEAATRR